MHFHLPKPLHGWRELVGEVGIIVVGVLIALGAEQLVERAHWSHQVDLERSALHSEIVENLDSVELRMALEPCVKARLAELQTLAANPPSEDAARIAGKVGLPLPSEGSRGAWSIALAGEALSHMPLKEQLEYSNAFANYENWDVIRGDERKAWLRLAVLDNPRVLTDADWVQIREAVAEATAADQRIAAVGPFIFRTANVGEKPDILLTPAQVFEETGYGSEICKPLLQADIKPQPERS
jgi:hypothetical protein